MSIGRYRGGSRHPSRRSGTPGQARDDNIIAVPVLRRLVPVLRPQPVPRAVEAFEQAVDRGVGGRYQSGRLYFREMEKVDLKLLKALVAAAAITRVKFGR